MNLRRRFVFRGCASAFGGHLIRPKDIVLESPGASALPVTGGRSVSTLSRTRFDEFFQIESASTFAEGLFEDRHRFLDFTNHKVEEDTLAAVTHVRAEVAGLVVGRKPRMTVKHLRSELHARSPLQSGQPSIKIGNVAVDGVDIDGYKLVVELNTSPFQKCDTHAKLLVAADDPKFVEESNGHYIQASYDTVYTTIVKSIRWDGKPFPGSQIEHNKVTLPDFGRVYFGELLISHDSRRLTMIRMALGSDSGGSASGADAQDNGGWSWVP